MGQQNVTKVCRIVANNSTSVEFHAFEIHILNADMRLLKSIPFFQRFHEIDILNQTVTMRKKVSLSRVFFARG